MLDPQVVHNPTHHHSINGPLNRNLPRLVPPVVEEIAAAFEETWGTDVDQWREVCLFDTMLAIVARVSNRVLVRRPF